MASGVFDLEYEDGEEKDAIWERLGQIDTEKSAGQILEELWASVAPRQTARTLRQAIGYKLQQYFG